ncbi:MAG: hypothetical protein JXL80_17345 [Planctomycetes bacterium]|nr:hypothetical protein [Planctomycetota bacterium]
MNLIGDTCPLSPFFPPPGAGREYTFGQLLKIALRQLWRNKGRVLKFGLAVALLAAVAQGLTEFLLNLLSDTVRVQLSEGQKIAISVALIALHTAANVVVTFLILEGYKWATIRGFDRPHMAWNDLLSPIRVPWRGSLLRLAALAAALSAAVSIANVLWFQTVIMRSAGGPRFSLGWQQVIMIVLGLLGALVVSYGRELLTLLTGPVMLASPRPSLREGLRENWRILCGQPRRMLAVAGIYTGLMLLIHVIVGLAMSLTRIAVGPGAYSSLWRVAAWQFLDRMALQMAHLVPLAVSLHLVAVLFRSAYGLPLEPDPQTQAAP